MIWKAVPLELRTLKLSRAVVAGAWRRVAFEEMWQHCEIQLGAYVFTEGAKCINSPEVVPPFHSV